MSFQQKFLLHLESKFKHYTKTKIQIACWLTLALAGIIDYLTADNFIPLNLYLFPLVLAAWFLERRDGIKVTALTTGVFVATDLISKTIHIHPYIHLWNVISIVFFFWMFFGLTRELHAFIRLRQSLAKMDRLSRILNQAALLDALHLEIKRRERDKEVLSVAVVSRHETPLFVMNEQLPDETFWLKQTGQTIRMNLRGGELVAQLEDRRFAFLLPGVRAENCKKVVEKIHYALNGMARSNRWPFLFDVAAVTYSELPIRPEDVMETLSSRIALLATKKESSTHHESIPIDASATESPEPPTEKLLVNK